ncbi:LysM peptidoglycan-binding domain-containing protein [Ramlibacter alkalitolerans]|jgi:nucleoid-associated protein YgaU|uniref:LysM peptidoglycan-binding domain-containing protein n=1 Tax=Ramlibacter alkalitolerans TaxID=2039631 RepID=A0ABS1JND1_9BURK|nr:LysM domain-containing protein [Ramlibacter alkalitolerans]MBL0425777.1 LysM peptidoglycan-binding domain-containing protein [Ramlibacter alkalitolerans]
MLRLKSCRCSGGEWKRISRASWMRNLFPARRLFACSACHRRFLVREDATEPNDVLAKTVMTLLATAAVVLAALGWLWSARQAAADDLAAGRPVLRPASATCQRVHVFKEGETLESIAQQELGDASMWQQIRIANRWLDTAQNGLEPGARLVVPAPCAG